MHEFKFSTLTLVLMLICNGAYAQQIWTEKPFDIGPDEGVFLIISDIHFDPFMNPALVRKLDQHPAGDWFDILSGSDADDFAKNGRDTSFKLMMSALEAAANSGPPYDYVMYTGDYLSHIFWLKYLKFNGLIARNYDDFVVKTITFVNMMLRKTLGDVPIYGTLGNNDAICGNYKIAPNGQFLAETSDQWSRLAKQANMINDYSAGGFYKVSHPTVPDQDLIVLNSVLWSTNYRNACSPDGDDPGEEQLAWLERQLRETQMQGKTASLAMHIPPGIDAYKTAHNRHSCSNSVVSFWQDDYTQSFLELMGSYESVVANSFAGHSHRDDFRVISGANGKPFFLTLISASVSPVYGNNPAFSFVLYDKRNGDLKDHAIMNLSNLEATASGSSPRWEIEYSFQIAYQRSDMSPVSLGQLADDIRSSDATRERFIKNYQVKTATQNPINAKYLNAIACTFDNITPADFIQCYCHGEVKDLRR